MNKLNYLPGFYAVANPCHDFLLKVLKRYDFLDFSDSEFWTLGGKEWFEYKHLVDNGVVFGSHSYHNVDHYQIDELDDEAVQIHRIDFFDIHKFWKKPQVINFDSTMALVESNQNQWQDLIWLGFEAARLSKRVLLFWNFLEEYARASFGSLNNGLYQQWLEMLRDSAEINHISIEIFSEGLFAPKDDSTTKMLAGCCILSGSKANRLS
jgi:hypothetical protein